MNTNIKKLAFLLGAAVLAAALTFTLLGCNKPSNPETSNNSGLSPEEQEAARGGTAQKTAQSRRFAEAEVA